MLEQRRFRAGGLQGLEAEALTASALALAEAPPDWRGVPLTEIELAARATETAREIDLAWRAYAELALANARMRAGQIQDNIEQLEWVSETYRHEVPETWLSLSASLAESYRLQGRFQDAFDTLATARRDLAQVQLGDAERVAVEMSLAAAEGTAYLDLGVMDEAARLFDEFKQLTASPYATPREIAASYAHRAAVLMGTHRGAEACALLDEALADERLFEFRGGFLSAQGQLNSTFEEEGVQPPGRARAKFMAALEAPLWEDRRVWAEIGLAEVLLRAGADLPDVRARLDATAQRIRDTFGEHAPFAQGRLATLRTRLALASGADSAELEQQLLALEAAFQRQLDGWDAAPLRPGGLGYLRFSTRQEVLVELVALSLRLRGPQAGAEAALGYLTRARSRGAVVRSIGGADAEFAELALGQDLLRTVREQLLEPGCGSLVYLPNAPGRSFVFAIDDQHLEAIPLPPVWVWRAATQQLQRRLRQRLSLPGLGGDYDDLAGPLAAALLPPAVQAHLARWRGVTIVGHDLVGRVPFELLPLEGRRALGLELAVDYLPSLFLGCVLDRRARSLRSREAPGVRLTVLVAPDEGGDSEFAPIPWEAQRADPWRNSYGPDSVRVLAGAEASPAALKRPGTARSDILQLIVHGDSRGTWRQPAALVLTADEQHPGGRFTAEDVEALELPGLVVLSVCGAARGPERIGDDLAGNLGGALLRGGANTTVLSSSDLEYGATLALTNVFHRRIARGDSPATAMLAARRSLALNPDYSDPVHWAVVQVLGLGQRPLLEPRDEPTSWIALGGAGLALALLAAGVHARRRSA